MKNAILFSIIAVFAVFSNVVHANQSLSKQLLGTWECSEEESADGVDMKIEYEQTYVRNGRSNAIGTFSLSSPSFEEPFEEFDIPEEVYAEIFPEGISFDYLAALSGTWEISEDKFLVETTLDHKFTRVSFPENDIEAYLSDAIPEESLQEIVGVFEETGKLFESFFTSGLPTGISESYEIVSLTKKSLVVVSESEGTKTECSRKKKKR